MNFCTSSDVFGYILSFSIFHKYFIDCVFIQQTTQHKSRRMLYLPTFKQKDGGYANVAHVEFGWWPTVKIGRQAIMSVRSHNSIIDYFSWIAPETFPITGLAVIVAETLKPPSQKFNVWRGLSLVPPDRDLIACSYRQLVPPKVAHAHVWFTLD